MKNYLLKAITALACVTLLAGLAGAAEISPALQMDTYTDAGIEEQSFGTDDTLWVASENGQPTRIAYLTFGGMTALPQQISSGRLKVYVKEVERPGKVSIHLYNQAAMDIITWADQPDFDPEALGTLDIRGMGWQTWDATAFVKKAAAECSEGCPFSVVLVADDDVSIAFTSMEGSANEEAVLQYEAS
ncbi:MAG: DNRLRE domain-containing protein [Methanotrichaceae archaeon]|nr:DNRLRE domain-containing protein [Methanotrichaceae archaeon]